MGQGGGRERERDCAAVLPTYQAAAIAELRKQKKVLEELPEDQMFGEAREESERIANDLASCRKRIEERYTGVDLVHGDQIERFLLLNHVVSKPGRAEVELDLLLVNAKEKAKEYIECNPMQVKQLSGEIKVRLAAQQQLRRQTGEAKAAEEAEAGEARGAEVGRETSRLQRMKEKVRQTKAKAAAAASSAQASFQDFRRGGEDEDEELDARVESVMQRTVEYQFLVAACGQAKASALCLPLWRSLGPPQRCMFKSYNHPSSRYAGAVGGGPAEHAGA